MFFPRWKKKTKMKTSDFKLLVVAIIFLFLNIIILVIYAEIVNVNPDAESSVDIILLARGRDRALLQYQLWNKFFQPGYNVQFLVIHTKDNKDTNDNIPNVKHYFSDYENEQDIFIHINQIIPKQAASTKFLWASDRVVPIQKVMNRFFEKGKFGSRFFSGLSADAMILNVHHLFEPTIIVGFVEYEKVEKFSSYSAFLAHFITGRHHLFANVAQDLLLPNPKNKAKPKKDREMFQVAHLNPTNPDQADLNQLLKSIWSTYL